MGSALFPGEGGESSSSTWETVAHIVGIIITAFIMVPKIGWFWGLVTAYIWPLTALFYIGKWIINLIF